MQSNLYTDFSNFTAMRRDARTQSPEAVKQTAQQFEALFIQMMLKSMRDGMSNVEGGLFNSDTERMYQDMLDKQLSVNIASNQGIGMAKMIAQQLSQDIPQTHSTNTTTTSSFYSPEAVSGAGDTQAVINSAPANENTSDKGDTADPLTWNSPRDFLDAIWPHAQRAAEELGTTPQVLAAQSALETGWGQHVSFNVEGNGYGLFGIKADRHWQGASTHSGTLEFKDGTMQREQAQFRAYDSVGEAFDDYVDFLRSHPRYREALEQAHDPVAFTEELSRAGYATDPAYSAKIQRVMNSEWLRDRS